jgi:protoheme IX farnesyltransferase
MVRVRGYVALTKPRIVELLLITTIPTMLLARRGLPSGWLILATLVGGTLAAGGANATNMYMDRDIDAVMHRTQGRPIVIGLVSPTSAIVFAGALEVIAFAELWSTVNLLSAWLALGATLFSVFVYTLWLKRRYSSNIVIGGAAGAVPVLVGWSAVTGRVGVAPLVLFAIIFLWTPPHFWALAVRYREDYAAADVPMLPVVSSLDRTARQILAYTVVVSGLSVGFAFIGHVGLIYLVPAVLLGVGFIAYAVAFARDRSVATAMRLFHFSITYLTVLFVAIAVAVLVRHP